MTRCTIWHVSPRDFDGFDEEWFWRDVESMRLYRVEVAWIRRAFDQCLAEDP